MKAAEQLTTKNVIAISTKEDKQEVRAITAEEKEFSAYAKLRIERANKRQVGNRFKAAQAAEEEAAKKKK